MGPTCRLLTLVVICLNCFPVPALVVHTRLTTQKFRDVEGKPWTFAPTQKKGLLVLFRDPQCPISRKNSGILVGYAQMEIWSQIEVIHVIVNPATTRIQALEDRKSFNLSGPSFLASENPVFFELEPVSTTEAVLLSPQGEILYRGGITDQFALGYSRPAPREEHLLNAIREHVAGKEIEVKRTPAPGCAIDRPSTGFVRADEESKFDLPRIQKIVEVSCVACHHVDGPAPFAFESLFDLASRAQTHLQAIEKGLMPPWGADLGFGPVQKVFQLYPADRELLTAWLKAPANGNEMLRRYQFAQKPRSQSDFDLVLESETVTVPRTGSAFFKVIFLETNLNQDRWIQSVEFKNKKPRVLHHLLMHRDIHNRDPVKFDENPSLVFGFAPGLIATVLPEKYGVFLPKGSRLAIELHYTPDGVEEQDQLEVKFKFHKKKPRFALRKGVVEQLNFEIPPGADNHKVSQIQKFESPGYLLGFGAHMHYRGKRMTFDLISPANDVERILSVDQFNFKWQQYYMLKEPQKVDRGWALKVEGAFDNSARNPTNPNSKIAVRRGDDSASEMMRGVYFFSEESPK